MDLTEVMTILKGSYNFRIGEIVYARKEHYDGEGSLIRIKDKGYEILNTSPTRILVKLEDDKVWRSRKINWYRSKTSLLNFL